MYEINKDSIEKKIIDSRFSEDEEHNKAIKNSLLSIMRELCGYTSEVNQNLIDRAFNQSFESQINEIYAVILPTLDGTEYEPDGLFKMTEIIPQRFFLDCEYDDIRNIVGDTSNLNVYKGTYIKDEVEYSFEYSLEFDNSFVKVQERLFDYAEHYNVSNPLIFSPFSHKAFVIKHNFNQEHSNPFGVKKDSGNHNEENSVDYRFKQNGIPVIEGQCCLFWNIRQDIIKDKTYDASEPYGEKVKYVYCFPKSKKGMYRLPIPINNQTCIYDIRFCDKDIKIVIDKEIEDFFLYEYYDLDLNTPVVKERQSKGLFFANDVNEQMKKQRRLLSEGDIERAIGYFRSWKDLYCKRADGDGKNIIRYAKKYCANRTDKYLFNTIRREYIHFEKQDKRFMTDYANYVLEYLEYYYPEIEWAGEE